MLPEVVSKAGKHYSIKYGPVVALLVEAIKEQEREIEQLKQDRSELATLKREMAELRRLLTQRGRN